MTWGSSIILFEGYTGIAYLGTKQLERETDHWHPTTAEVKNNGAVPPLPYTPSWPSWRYTNSAYG
jgi:hypothetical protein